MNLSEKDLQQIAQRGISQEQIETQLHQFETGFPFLRLDAAAAVGRGIVAPVKRSASSMLQPGKPIRPRAAV